MEVYWKLYGNTLYLQANGHDRSSADGECRTAAFSIALGSGVRPSVNELDWRCGTAIARREEMEEEAQETRPRALYMVDVGPVLLESRRGDGPNGLAPQCCEPETSQTPHPCPCRSPVARLHWTKNSHLIRSWRRPNGQGSLAHHQLCARFTSDQLLEADCFTARLSLHITYC